MACDHNAGICESMSGGICSEQPIRNVATTTQQMGREPRSMLDLWLGNGDNSNGSGVIDSITRGASGAIVASFAPYLISLTKKYPRLVKMAYIPVVFWLLWKYVIANLEDMWEWLMSYALASVTISRDDQIFYNNVRSWLLMNVASEDRRTLNAQLALTAQHCGTKVTDNRRVVYEGKVTFQCFRHKNGWFIFTDKGVEIVIYTVGWSSKRIQELLDEIEGAQEKKEEIAVFTAGVKYGQQGEWLRRNTMHRRSLDCVCLNAGIKDKLIEDISDYLHPDAALWYADRGIPYRRGFLLHGRPGCGKTSFAMAVAGQFKMNIYTVSLVEEGITDAVLLRLFQNVPVGSLVLMEDIDSAGIGRQHKAKKKTWDDSKADDVKDKVKKNKNEEETDSDDSTSSSSDSSPDEATKSKTRTKKSKAKKKREAKRRKEKKKAKEDQKLKKEADAKATKPAVTFAPVKSQVTLSGLLNAIDGASAPEGHLLIMTSNKPELLDEALIRPGRVDVRVEFEYATTQQIKEMFVKMYKVTREDQKTRYDPEKADALAKQFGDKVPAGEFSPAQVQEYLIPHRTQPQEAVNGIGEWVKMKLEQREKRSKAEVEGDVEPKVSGVSRLFHGGAKWVGEQMPSVEQSSRETARCGAVLSSGWACGCEDCLPPPPTGAPPTPPSSGDWSPVRRILYTQDGWETPPELNNDPALLRAEGWTENPDGTWTRPGMTEAW